MASNIVLKTYAAGDNNQGSVTPQNDALIYQAAIPTNGLFFGGTVTLSSANVLHVAAGMGIIGGRFFEILESEIAVQLSASGDLLGRLYIHLDLSNADNPIEIKTYTGASLPALSGDPNLNVSSGSFDMELCTFEVNELTISNIVNKFPTIKAANNQIRRATAYSVNDFALCQSASDALIFICTTAGTTAVQEPTAYATATDGNTVTDGTAVFKAVSVAGKINAIGNITDLDTTDKSSTVAAINEVNTKVSKTEVLISNSGDAYDPTKAYAVGELCIYNNKLYRCTTACSAGSWATNQSCFTQDTLVNAANKFDLLTNPSTQIYSDSTGLSDSWKNICSISVTKGTYLVFVIFNCTVARNEIMHLAIGVNSVNTSFVTNENGTNGIQTTLAGFVRINTATIINARCATTSSAYAGSISATLQVFKISD